MTKSPTNLKNVKQSDSRERAARAAIIIAEYLRANPLGASPRKLEEVVLKHHPEWVLLHEQTAGKNSYQSRLTNDIAWGKNALKDGGYTITIKGAARGGKDILKLNDKGKQTDFSKKDDVTYEQHFVLIVEGRL